MDLIHSRWRPPKGRTNKKRQWARQHFAKIRERKAALKMQSEKEALVEQEFVSENQSDCRNGPTSGIDIESEKLLNDNKEFTNRTLVKEEVIIKDEKLEDSMMDTTERNLTDEVLLPALEPTMTDPVSNQIQRETPIDKVTEIPAKYYNVRLGVDKSLQNELSNGTLSLEKVIQSNSKTVVVFRKLPDLVPIMKACEKCGKIMPLKDFEVHLRGCSITLYCKECPFTTTDEKKLHKHCRLWHSITEVQKIHTCYKSCFKKGPRVLPGNKKTMLNVSVCNKCGENLPLKDLKAHLRGCGITYYCRECSFITTHKKLLHIHFQSKHPNTEVLRVHTCNISCFEKEPRVLSQNKKTMLSVKGLKICQKCNVTTDVNTEFSFCTTCKVNYHYQCKNCKQIMPCYPELIRHLKFRCIKGLFHCANCGFGSKNVGSVRCHLLYVHGLDGLNIDSSHIQWRNFSRDANGDIITDQICTKCSETFDSIDSFNFHLITCQRISVVCNPVTGSEGLGTTKPSCYHNGIDCRKEIVEYCEKCDTTKTSDWFCFSTCQPFCSVCQTELKFKCIQCDSLHNSASATKHFKSYYYSSKENHVCDYCEKTFQSKRCLEQHVMSEFKEHMANSNEKIEYALGQERKEETIHSFLCQKCDAAFDNSYDLATHLKECDEKLQMQCKVLLTRLK